MRQLRPFIQSHIKQIFSEYQRSVDEMAFKQYKRIPFDSYLRNYYKENKTLGPSERSIISESAYKVLRNSLLFQYLSKSTTTDAQVSMLLEHDLVQTAINNPNIPHHVRCSCPKELFDLIANTYGTDNAYSMLLNSNEKAPLTIRVNPLKATREEVKINNNTIYTYNKVLSGFRRKDNQLTSERTEHSPYGIVFQGHRQMQLQGTPMFVEGLFEIQDEASQICALRVECKPKERVLDYCAGSGGKSLAFAHQMENTGQIVLHDVREEMLIKAKKRLARAGVQNILLLSDRKKITSKFDWVLLDVPCTGLGTLRRNPDLKLYFQRSSLTELVEKQRRIFDEGIRLLKPDGKIVYITCSFLKEENEDQIAFFCKKHNLSVQGGGVFQSLPKKGQMDSFFSATLMRN